MSVNLNRARVFCLCLLFVVLFCPLEALAFEARARVDGDSVVVFWQGDNDPSIADVVLSGPESRSSSFAGSRIRFENLQPGSYSITVTRGDEVETLSAIVSSDIYSISERSGASTLGSSAVSLQLAGIETSLYPGIALQFRPLDSNGDVIKTPLSSGGFSIYEEGKKIPDFSVLSPSSSGANRTADLVIVFDNTGSMFSEIEMLKDHVESFLTSIAGAGIDLRYRLVTYKDDVDDSRGWTTSPSVLKSQIGSLSASGGIEIPEDGFEAMKVATDYDFRPGAYRFIMLVTDAPSWEGTDENGKDTPTRDEMVSALNDNNVVLYAITCDDSGGGSQYNGEGSLTDVTGGKWYDLMGNFSSIIGDIGDIIGSTYLISYTTPNTPDTLGGDDTVNVSVLYDGAVRLDTSYKVNIPPVAVVYPPTAMTPYAGASLPFEVRFSDPDNDGISGLRFYYRFVDGVQKYIDFSEASLRNLGGRLTVQIPAGDVPEGKGMFYSVRVTDGEGARGSFPRDGSFAYVDRDRLPFSISDATSHVDSDWNMIVDLELLNLDESAHTVFTVYKSPTGDFTGVAGSVIRATGSDGRYRIVLSQESLDGIGAVMIGVNSAGLMKKTRVFYYSGDLVATIRGKADTVILTNLSAMNGDTSDLEDSISQLIEAAWDVDSSTGRPRASNNSGYNMLPVVIDLQDEEIMTGVGSAFQLSWGDLSSGSASSVISGIDQVLRVNGFSNRDSMSLVITGSNAVIPYGVGYNVFSSVAVESSWYLGQVGASRAPALQGFYSGNNYPSDVEYRDSFRTGRLVETADDAAALLDKYRQDRGYLVNSKKFLYLSGYDTNNPSQGFLLGKWLRDYAAGSPGGWRRDVKSVYNPVSGFSGTYSVAAMNGLDSGMAVMLGHGDYYLTQNGKTANDYLFSGSSSNNGDVSEMSGLGDTLLFTNACHTGINFRSSYTGGYNGSDFPEAYSHVGRSIGVYIANSSYGMYSVSSVGYGDRFVQNAVSQIAGGSSGSVVYDSVFNGIALPYSSTTNRDLMSRPQFYGIPNYRMGPAPVTSKTAGDVAVSRSGSGFRTMAAVAEGDRFFSRFLDRDFSSMRLKLDFAMVDTDYDVSEDGSLKVHGIDQGGAYGRPALIYSVPVPVGSVMAEDLSVELVESSELGYGGLIVERVASSTGEIEEILDTDSYDEMPLVDASIEGDRLTITVWPVQYDTADSTMRVARSLSISAFVSFPRVTSSLSGVDDLDMDGLPDYWERGYGLDGRDPSGKNGSGGDMDGDGVSNLQEFCKGSDPQFNGKTAFDRSWGINPPLVSLAVDDIGTSGDGEVEISLFMPDKTMAVEASYWIEGDPSSVQTTPRFSVNSDGVSPVSLRIAGLKRNASYVVTVRGFDSYGFPSISSEQVVFSASGETGPGTESSAGGCQVGPSYGNLLFLLAGFVLLRR